MLKVKKEMQTALAKKDVKMNETELKVTHSSNFRIWQSKLRTWREKQINASWYSRAKWTRSMPIWTLSDGKIPNLRFRSGIWRLQWSSARKFSRWMVMLQHRVESQVRNLRRSAQIGSYSTRLKSRPKKLSCWERSCPSWSWRHSPTSQTFNADLSL